MVFVRVLMDYGEQDFSQSMQKQNKIVFSIILGPHDLDVDLHRVNTHE